MARQSCRQYNLKPKEFLTPEFLYNCIKSTDGFDQLRKYSHLLETENDKRQEALIRNREKTLLFHFHINNCVDIQSILKTIVLLTQCEEISSVKSSSFNPSDVSIDSILNQTEALSYLYLIKAENLPNKEFYIKITPKEMSATKISIKAHPYQLALAMKMIHYLGGHMNVPIKKDNLKFKQFHGYQSIKFSQQGRWKLNFTKNNITSTSAIQKQQFFKDITPLSITDVSLLMKSIDSDKKADFIDRLINDQYWESILILVENETIKKKIELKEKLEKIIEKKSKNLNLEEHNIDKI